MPAPMSLDLRLRIVRAVARQLDPPGGAAFCGQPVGGDQADPAGAGDRERRAGALWRPSPAAARAHEADLRELVAATPDITLAELQTALERRLGLRAGLSTIHNALRRIGLRLKKSR